MKQDIQNGMKNVRVNVDQTELFAIINNIGMEINVDVNVKNQLIEMYAIKDLFGILVIVNASAINLVISVNIQIIETVSVDKKLVDPLVEECTENINETKLVEKTLDKNENKDKCNSYVVYKVLFWTFFIFFIINLGIGTYFIYRKYVNRKCGLLY